MIKFIHGPDNAIAVSLSGKITGDDLNKVMDRLEFALNVFSRVDVFVETHEIIGFEFSATASYAARALPLFSKLDCFDRVAVVADQAWIRIATRVESALLPSISYRVFEPSERAGALAWVFHEEAPNEPNVAEMDRAA
jgi:hypothetical protein